jgi:hypothetical protein
MADSTAIGDLLAGAAGRPVDRPGLEAFVANSQSMNGLHTAQTVESLINAQDKVREQQAQDSLEGSLTDMYTNQGMPYAQAAANARGMSAIMKSHFGTYQQAAAGALDVTKNQAAVQLLNPNSSADQSFRADAVLNPGANPSQNVGDQLVPRFAPGAATGAGPVVQTPASTANTNKAQADANLATAQANDPRSFHPGGVGAAGNAPAGYQWAVNPDGSQKVDDNGQPVLSPITGGDKDPNTQKPMSAVERRYFQTSANSATGAIAELGNVMNLKTGANAGVMGLGAHNGQSALGTVAANARNAIAAEDVQLYNTRINNLSRMMAIVENTGRMPPGTAVESINQMQLQPGDTEYTRLTKLAQGRQNLDAALNTWLHTANLNADSKSYMYDLLSKLHNTIPFTIEDVDKWAQSKDPHKTIKDEVKGTVGSVPGVAPVPGNGAGGLPAGWTVTVQ